MHLHLAIAIQDASMNTKQFVLQYCLDNSVRKDLMKVPNKRTRVFDRVPTPGRLIHLQRVLNQHAHCGRVAVLERSTQISVESNKRFDVALSNSLNTAFAEILRLSACR